MTVHPLFPTPSAPTQFQPREISPERLKEKFDHAEARFNEHPTHSRRIIMERAAKNYLDLSKSESR